MSFLISFLLSVLSDLLSECPGVPQLHEQQITPPWLLISSATCVNYIIIIPMLSPIAIQTKLFHPFSDLMKGPSSEMLTIYFSRDDV